MELRQYIEVLKQEGLLWEVDQEVDWNLEASAIGCMMQRISEGRFALLFNNIKDYPGKGRLATNLLTGPYKRPWERNAIMMGLPRDIDQDVFMAEFIRRLRNEIRPIEVSKADAPCKEVIKLGKDASLVDFPIPMVHETDGGRYLTCHLVINQDPDTAWTNVALYRFMVKSPRRWASLFSHGQQGPEIFYRKWEARGQTMPICIAVGVDPLALCVATMAAPAGLCEYDWLGGLRQEPLEVVRAETNNLLVPAGAEIVIEGEVRPYERTDEGPFGEMAGFTHGRNISPVFRVTAITYRQNPIIPIIIEGAPMTDDQGITNVPMCAANIVELQRRGFPVTDVDQFAPTPPAFTFAIDPTTPYDVRRVTEFFFGTKNLIWTSWLAATDAGTDGDDWSDVLEQVGLNFDPRDLKKNLTDMDGFIYPVQFYTEAENRFLGRDGGKYCYDCTTRFKDPRFLLPRDIFEKAYSEETKQFVSQAWSKLGFDKRLDIKHPLITKAPGR